MEKPIGHLVREVLQSSGMKIKVFAERIGTTRQNVYKIFEKDAIRTDLLLRICKVLEHDFFAYFRKELDGDDVRVGSVYRREYQRCKKELVQAHARIKLLEQRMRDKDEIIDLMRGG